MTTSDSVGSIGMSGIAPASTRWAWRAEDALCTLALGGMVLIPLVEALLRAAFDIGISSASAIVQHLTLVVGMVGATIAAREKRLLALSTGELLPEAPRRAATIFASGFAAAIAVVLTIASVQFLVVEREVGARLAYGVPVWTIQLVLPIGFALVAARLLWHASPRWRDRAIAAAIAATIVATGVRPFAEPSALVVPALALLLLAVVAGAPVFAALGGAAAILFWGAGSPIDTITLDHYSLVTNPSLPTIPLFTLAGYFLAEGGASTRLVRVFQALVGRLRGGPAIVTTLVCAFFTTFTGASGVTILALGGLLMPVLIGARYSEKTALGLLTGAGSLGLLFPPCLPLILYAIVAQITMQEMFLGGIVPGVVMLVLAAAWGVHAGPKERSSEPFRAREAWAAVWEAKWELLLPVVALAALFGGFATPVEAAALTALYAFVIEAFFYRDYRGVGHVVRIVTECGLLVGGVLLILGVALGFTNYLIDAEIPSRAVEWTTSSIESPWMFLLLLNLFLLVVGCLMDIYSAIVVVVPLIVPIGVAFGIDPVHLGIIFLTNLQLGYLTPPVGMNLFLASYRFNKPLSEVVRASFPILLVFLIGVVLITYVPPLTTLLPRLLAK